MTNAAIGYGTLFQILTATGPDVWTTIGEQVNVTPPSIAVDAVDATHNESPDAFREFIPGLADGGEVSFDINYYGGDAGVTALLARLRAVCTCRIVLPNGYVWSFSGILTGLEPETSTEDKMAASVTFKVTGKPTLAAPSAPTNTVKPAISGIAQVGVLLTALPGVWTGAPTFAYQWKNEGVAINGETAATYTPVVGDVGDNITVTVTGTNAAGNASATSAETLPVIAA